jgi:transposase
MPRNTHRQEPAEAPSGFPVQNLGVDDWAWLKGLESGTILVNLDLRVVVDLLPNRDAESFSEWLGRIPKS